MALLDTFNTAAQKPDYWTWQAEDYDRELKRIKQAKLDLAARSGAIQASGDTGSLAALQKAAQGLDAREVAVQARGNRDVTAGSEQLSRAWGLNPPAAAPGDQPRAKYTDLLAAGQDIKNIGNVLGGSPMQALNVHTSSPGYLADEDAARPRSGGAAGEVAGGAMASPYSALQNAQLDEMHAAGMNPAIARAMQLAKLRQAEGQADTAVGQSPWGQETARNAARGDLMSGRADIFSKAQADIENQRAREKEVSEAGTFFQPEVASKRMVTTDAATQAKNLQYVIPQALKNVGGANIAGIVGQMNLKRFDINGYVAMFNKMLDAKSRDATATQLSQEERDRATEDYNNLREMIKGFQSARAIDDQQ